MNNFYLHTEKYSINDELVNITAHFGTGDVHIRWPQGKITTTIDDYNDFDGDMKSFAKHLIHGDDNG
jgi:major membrane immunogen (membrane-anchored lipoprotein)